MANLSKSKYITYCQCPKALWLKQYKSEEMVIDPLTQARFDAGSEVGELAKRLFGDFVEVTVYKNPTSWIFSTRSVPAIITCQP